MSSHTGSGDNYLYSVGTCGLCKVGSGFGCSVGGDYSDNGLYAEQAELVDTALHHRHITVGTHDYRYSIFLLRCHIVFSYFLVTI
jgi:hypothetical protein